MTRTLVLLGLLLGGMMGCEGDYMRACSAACDDGGKAMVSYSAANGCVCEDRP